MIVPLGKRKLIYACCLIVFTRSVSLRQSACPLKGGQIPWKNPCGGQSSNEAPTEVPPTISNDKDWLRDLYVVLMELNQNFTALKALYYVDPVVYRLITKCGYMESDFFHLEGFPDADKSRIPDDLSNVNISVEILKDYKKMATILVFVEQIVNDGDTHGGQDNTDTLCSLYYKLRTALCLLQIHSNSVMIDDITPTRNVMKREYRTINKISRMTRNYIIFKDGTKFLNIIINKYVRLYFTL